MASRLKGNRVIGIVREVYNKWERRTPLCPTHVQRLARSGVRVLVQPSSRRVFSDEEYRAAGAELTDDLSDASVIFGVKQVPVEQLLPNRSYVFFSHVIKAQPENMELLDAVLDRKIRLFDYECITSDGRRGSPRLIAFGSYAGYAGMVTGLRGLGERLLCLGHSSPFLSLGSAYMYPDLTHARAAVSAVGDMIARGGLPAFPDAKSPMVVAFSGNGNVSRAAQEIFKLLPHEFVQVSDLPNLQPARDRIYGVVVEEENMAELSAGPTRAFDRAHYYANPEEYRGTFAERVAPYVSMLVNATYWDNRYPRLLTLKDMDALAARDAARGTHNRFLAVADISCDIRGSVEFLTHSTPIERPFYLYDARKKESRDALDGDGVLVMGVDILPSELPRESSNHFGDLLLGFVEPLATSDGTLPFSEQALDLGSALHGACIAAGGELTPAYSYISKMRSERKREQARRHARKVHESAGSGVFRVRGHLFDTNLINQMLDLIESQDAAFKVLQLDVNPNASSADLLTSSAEIQVSVPGGRKELDILMEKIESLAALTPLAEATVTVLPWDYCQGDFSATLEAAPPMERQASTTEGPAMSYGRDGGNPTSAAKTSLHDVLVLGAGLVAQPAVEYLSRATGRTVTVASAVPHEAQKLARALGRPNVIPLTLDAQKDTQELHKRISDARVVVSLLPASMHVPVAEAAISAGVHVVTASYVSPEMRALDAKARAAGVSVLGEMGLDPGMDHMSAMAVIDKARAQGAKIDSFSSLCGGLPAPEAANNPLRYKFSWSPQGVLSAAGNPALYRVNGDEKSVLGQDLLSSATLTDAFPSLSLEQLPNRDAMPYGDAYGINDAEGLYRGTLRYAGWSAIMDSFRAAKLFSHEPVDLPSTWSGLMDSAFVDSQALSTEARRCLAWLGAFGDESVSPSASNVQEAMCSLLSDRLAYEKGERDMALMRHDIKVSFPNEPERPNEVWTSSFIAYGSEDPTGDTIMAKTVGLTVAVGAEIVMAGEVPAGVSIPTTPDVYGPGLKMLEAEGIRFQEEIFVEQDE